MSLCASPAQAKSDGDKELGRRVGSYLRAQRPEFGSVKVEALDETVVRLSGPLASFHARQVAVATAKRVAGVRRIIDDIVVSNPA